MVLFFERGQGATEYLILLAAVLIIALASIALLGFFPGAADDTRIAESEAYWRSATPVSIMETSATRWSGSTSTYPYIRIRNTGGYAIRITGLIGADGGKITKFRANADADCGYPYTGYYNLSDYYYMAPGEEKYFSWEGIRGIPCTQKFYAVTGSTGSDVQVGGATSLCQNSSAYPGRVEYKSFGFEYVLYVEGQAITKRQVGKQLIIKCQPPPS